MKNLILATALCFSFVGPSFAQAPAAPAPAAAVATTSAATAPVVVAAPATAPAEAAPAAILPPPPANTIPAAGKILSVIFQVLGIMGAVGTALIGILLAVQAAFKAAGKVMWAPLGVAALWVEALLPWIKYASLYKPASTVAAPAPAPVEPVAKV